MKMKTAMEKVEANRRQIREMEELSMDLEESCSVGSPGFLFGNSPVSDSGFQFSRGSRSARDARPPRPRRNSYNEYAKASSFSTSCSSCSCSVRVSTGSA